MPRPGPRTADNHRREPLSVSQPTHTFKFPDPAPLLLPADMRFRRKCTPRTPWTLKDAEYLPVCPKRHSSLEERTL